MLLDAPAVRTASEYTLRPLVANCETCWPSITSLTSLVSDCTAIALASTLMLSVAAPTSSLKSTRSRSPTLRVMFFCSPILKPGASARTVYWPICSPGAWYWPEPSPVTRRICPVAWFVIVIATLGTAALVGSVMVPRIVASCAAAPVTNMAGNAQISKNLRSLDGLICLLKPPCYQKKYRSGAGAENALAVTPDRNYSVRPAHLLTRYVLYMRKRPK